MRLSACWRMSERETGGALLAKSRMRNLPTTSSKKSWTSTSKRPAWAPSRILLCSRPLVRTDAADMLKRRLNQAGLPATLASQSAGDEAAHD